MGEWTKVKWTPRHTPGRCIGAPDVWCIDWSKDQEEVAEIVHGKANAHLMASAPELYEALQEVLSASIILNSHGHVVGKAQKALAKARGEA